MTVTAPAVPDVLSRFGVLSVRGFLDPRTCAWLRDEARNAAGVPAGVRGGGEPGGLVEPRLRHAEALDVSDAARAELDGRLTAVQPMLAQHFGVVLSKREEVAVLRYRPGGFYVAHRDRTQDPAAVVPAPRLVSVVAFLNGPGAPSEPGTYGGGVLTFGVLGGDPRLSRTAIPLAAAPGLLVAFRSDVVHAVTPVTHGERYTVVTWFA